MKHRDNTLPSDNVLLVHHRGCGRCCCVVVVRTATPVTSAATVCDHKHISGGRDDVRN